MNVSNKRVLPDERALLLLSYQLGLCADLYGVKVVRVMKCKSKTLITGKGRVGGKIFSGIIELLAILALRLQTLRLLFKCLYGFSHCEWDFEVTFG